MKRMFILVAIALFTTGLLFAEENTLIDFSKLVADIIPNQDNVPTQNRATMMDYSNVAGGSFTDDQRGAMRTSLAIANWDVVLSSSSRTVENQIRSYTREAPSQQFGTVLGVRIHFPVEPYNAWARIKPPFEIPAYEAQADVDDEGNIRPVEGGSTSAIGASRFENDYGVIKNVGDIKSIAVRAYGLNFPHGISACILDSTGREQVMFLGYLNYDGWGELRWDNPQYIQAVRNRELRLYPLYPTTTPFIKFNGFIIQRDAAKEGGDFIGYIKDVRVIYDKAVLDTDRDIDDEAIWNIIEQRETDKKRWEMSRFGAQQILRYLDAQKQATEDTFHFDDESATQ
jgi:hypothetical protein